MSERLCDMNTVSEEEAAFRAAVWDNPYLIQRSIKIAQELKRYLETETPPPAEEVE